MKASHPLLELTVARLKEFGREPGAVFWTFGFPLLLTVALGIAFRAEGPSPVTVGVLDGDGAPAILAALDADERLAPALVSAAEAERALRGGKLSVLVEPGPTVGYRLDPTRPEARAARLLVDDVLQRAAGRADARPVEDHAVEAPGARYVDWLVPGLLGMQLMSGSLWGIAWVIVQTRSRKLLKRLVATPMRRRHYLAAFLLARLVPLAIEVPLLFGFAWLAFDVAIHGSIAAVATVSLLGAWSFAGVGLLCASRAQNTETVNGLVNLVTLPMFVVSGVFFSSSRFPDALQPLISLLPLTALNDALRGVVNEGASLAALWRELAILGAWGAGSFALSLKIFRWS